MTIKVWYKLDEAPPSKVELQDDADVDDLKKKIKTEWGDRLPCSAPELNVFAAGVDPKKNECLDPGENVPSETTSRVPLIVNSPQQHRHRQQQHGRPPLHPEIESSTEDITRKLDQILVATQNTDRATPHYSAAFVGNKERHRLVLSKRFVEFKGTADEASVLTAEEMAALSKMQNEHQVVSFMTPFLEDIVRDHVSSAVINSEEYKWIKTTSETSKYNEKPDLIIIHPALVDIKPPFKCNKDEALKAMRRTSDQFGILSQWKLREYIGLTCEAKQTIDNQAFGEVINYGAHICFGDHGSVSTRLILFDKRVFWLVESIKGTISCVTTCAWDEGGSKRLLLDFIPETALPNLLKDACAHFNLTVSSNSFLGSGAFGFVFRAQRADGVNVALKIVLKNYGYGGPDKNIERLSFEKEKMLRAKQLCPDDVMGLEEDCFNVFENGAALLMSEVGDHFSRLAPQSIVDSLKRLHENGIIHGDARLENVVSVNKRPCWIDFAAADFYNIPEVMEREFKELCDHVKVRFSGYTAV